MENYSVLNFGLFRFKTVVYSLYKICLCLSMQRQGCWFLFVFFDSRKKENNCCDLVILVFFNYWCYNLFNSEALCKTGGDKFSSGVM